MSENLHTPEPWRLKPTDRHKVEATPLEEGTVVASCWTSSFAPPREEAAANARRIVAAVNACEGIDTEDLEAGLSMVGLHAELGSKAALLEALGDAAAVLALTAEQLRSWAEVVPGLAAAIRRKADFLDGQAVALRDLIARAKGGA